MNTVIHTFLYDRKNEWVKGKLKPSMNEEEILLITQEGDQKYSLKTWLPDAAKRAKQLSMATHPSKFSHPSAKTSSIIAESVGANDGYLRTGNVQYDMDVFGNAAALDVYKFLSLIMEDGQTVLAHLEKNTADIQVIFALSEMNFDVLREGFLSVKQTDITLVTDGLVKQVYFPVLDNYHLLSILTPSGLLNTIKQYVENVRFSEITKEARECRKKELPHLVGFDDFYDLTQIGYGGTKPQNISVLNSQSGGRSYLLPSTPPTLVVRDLRLPRTGFLTNTIRERKFEAEFQALIQLSQRANNLENRNKITEILSYIVEQILEVAMRLRQHYGAGWSNADTYQNLPVFQKIWLDDQYEVQRSEETEWFDELSHYIARWIIRVYEKTSKKLSIKLGDAEFDKIKDIIEEFTRGQDKEFF